jgi:hypothetical protein
MPQRHTRPAMRASFELALIGVTALCIADVRCR